MTRTILLTALACLILPGLCDDICNWDGGTEVVLYHEYRDPPCTPPNNLLPSGDCEPRVINLNDLSKSPSCASFCQIRTNFFYGTEVPLMNAYCHGPMTCSVSESVHIGTSWKLKIPGNFNILGIKSGISGGFTGDTQGVTKSQSRSVTLDGGQCGYFTFLPIDKVVCGTYTSSQFPQPKQISPDQCTQNVQTTGNACLTDRQTYKDGGWFPWTKQSTIRGDTVFVRTDCSNRQRLPLDQQDPAYNNPGVSLDQGLYDGYAAFWENGIENQATALVMNDANTQCAKGTVATAPHAQYDHCVDAISQILQEPYNTMPVLGKNDQQTVMVTGSCQLAVQYQQDWAPDCKVTWAEVAAAATTFINGKCLITAGTSVGMVAGSQALRNGGKCSSVLVVIGF